MLKQLWPFFTIGFLKWIEIRNYRQRPGHSAPQHETGDVRGGLFCGDTERSRSVRPAMERVFTLSLWISATASTLSARTDRTNRLWRPTTRPRIWSPWWRRNRNGWTLNRSISVCQARTFWWTFRPWTAWGTRTPNKLWTRSVNNENSKTNKRFIWRRWRFRLAAHQKNEITSMVGPTRFC